MTTEVDDTSPDLFILPESKRASARTAQEWVDFYLDLEDKVAQAKSVRSDDLNRTVEMHELDEIRKARREWERKAALEKHAGTGRRCGGLRYGKADLSR